MMFRIFLLFLCTFVGSAAMAAPPTADDLALRILDSEALYTLNGLKPISDGFWQTRFPADRETTDELESVREILARLPLGPHCEAGVFVFATPFDGQRSASAFVVHRPSLRALVIRRKDVFEPLGITPETPPQQVMERIDRGSRSARWRAFGYVFGYPDYAVEFFVHAGEQQAETKKFVERDFVQLPTFKSDEGRFVYAVPKGHIERNEDRILKAATVDIFTRYRAWRAVYIDERKFGPVELLRNWVSPPLTALCAPPVVNRFSSGHSARQNRTVFPQRSTRHDR